MTRNKVMNLWTALVTAFLALFTALGFVSNTAAAAVPHTETSRNSGNGGGKGSSDDTDRGAELSTAPAPPHWAWSYARALPPTMKQRIRAEAHGKTPGCRHSPLSDTEVAPSAPATRECATAGSAPAQPLVPHQR
ncbi:hypothetical protein SZN_30807 [Streptomyces zinciresistens K42]|uniref:Secreted protein n=1 Tax=Streptomyces zinciresistens K42 TaxID=700597 RepID=G2GKW8_9ACTN|nr:DUF6344 domain-containing protein [Streptomyces zinciresistens]EGX55840.1 hypothetical protein SZN_30807 [Streptomyces zinciresistens K42]